MLNGHLVPYGLNFQEAIPKLRITDKHKDFEVKALDKFYRLPSWDNVMNKVFATLGSNMTRLDPRLRVAVGLEAMLGLPTSDPTSEATPSGIGNSRRIMTPELLLQQKSRLLTLPTIQY